MQYTVPVVVVEMSVVDRARVDRLEVEAESRFRDADADGVFEWDVDGFPLPARIRTSI